MVLFPHQTPPLSHLLHDDLSSFLPSNLPHPYCSSPDRNGIVVLFTNDKQLYNKAVVSGVRAMDRKALLPELRAKVKASCTAEKSAPREEGGALVPGNTQGCVVPLAHDTTAQQCAHLHLQPLALYGSCTTNSSPTPSPTTPSTPLSSYFEDVPAQQKSTMSEAQVGEEEGREGGTGGGGGGEGGTGGGGGREGSSTGGEGGTGRCMISRLNMQR